jgi:hypothetical protein
MYQLLMFLGFTQMVLGVIFVLAGAAVVIVNRIIGEQENHITKFGRRVTLVGWWLVLIGVVAMITVFLASVPVRRA